jgi:hypothetical protein
MKLLLLPLLIATAAPISAAQSLPETTPPPPVASIDGLPIGTIPKQTLPTGSCAAFLWSQTPSQGLIAMISASPAGIRFSPGGIVTDLVRVGQTGEAQFGLAATTDYAGGDFRVTVEMEIVKRGDLTDGAAVPRATMRVDQAGKDSVIVPAAGIIGCG